LKTHEPDAIADLNGLPLHVRDQHNRERIHARLQELYAELAHLGCPITPQQQAYVKKTRALIAAHEAMLAPDLTVLLYDPTGDGRAAIAIGDLATASHIGILVPGTGTELDDFGGMIRNTRALNAEAIRQGSRDHAVIARLGYDAPPDIPAASTKGYALGGAIALAPFVHELRTINTRHAEVTVMGHSYGSTVTGTAATAGMKADRIVLVGSPGTHARNADGLGMSPKRICRPRSG
jgi:hypothetical protein